MKLKSFLGSIFVLLLFVSTASALPLSTTQGLPYNNYLRDSSAEYLLTGNDTTVDIGDTLVGDLLFHEINTTEIGTGTSHPGLTAHFEVVVTGKTGNDTIGYSYTFGSAITDDTDPLFGAMAWLYLDPDHGADFTDPSSFVDPPNLWAVFGLTDSSTKWTAWTKDDDILELAEIVAGDPGAGDDNGKFNFYLDVLVNNTNLIFNDVGNTETQFTGSGIFAGLTDDFHDDYQIGDQAIAYINVVPEPATMFLLGTGLLGAAFVSRRRKED